MSSRASHTAHGWWARLFGNRAQSEAAQRLAGMERQLAELRGRVEALHAAVGQAAERAAPDLDAFHQALQGLEKQVGRAGREQLKTNSVAEAQAAQLAAALEQLRAAEARRAAELDALREQSRGAQAAARLELVKRILPALDGLDEALRAGQTLLASAPPREGERTDGAEPAPGGWWRRLLGEPSPAPAAPPRDDGQIAELREGLAAWLRGLTFVRQRLLDVLEAEDVRPIAAAGQQFDPNYHAAIGVAPATERHPPGAVVEELRRGYLAGKRPLRHAEVVVATADEQEGELA